MQKPDWHCIGALEARDVQISGVTCVVRARTWSVQMKDTSGFIYDDLRVIGGNPGNANQDGMDWLGGGDALVRNTFLRASDDDIAMQGNWDGYTDEEILRPGHDVQNIVVEGSQLSTSISNIVRSAWPQKIFNSRNFTLRNSDILHGGIGACGQTFGLLGMWGANGSKGDHSNYTFENLWLDNWYSLVQIDHAEPAVHGFTFRNIWALDQPPLASSTLTGNVTDVTFDNVKYGQNRATNDAELQLVVAGGAATPKFPAPSGPVARFTIDPPVFGPGDELTFTAMPSPARKLHVVLWRRHAGQRPHRPTSLCRCGRHRFGRAEWSGKIPSPAESRRQKQPRGLGRAVHRRCRAVARLIKLRRARLLRASPGTSIREHGRSCPI